MTGCKYIILFCYYYREEMHALVQQFYYPVGSNSQLRCKMGFPAYSIVVQISRHEKNIYSENIQLYLGALSYSSAYQKLTRYIVQSIYSLLQKVF